MRNFLAVLIIIIWLILGFFYYKTASCKCLDNLGISSNASTSQVDNEQNTMLDEKKEMENNQGSSSVQENQDPDSKVRKKAEGPILFQWNGVNPIFSDKWSSFKTQILDNLDENQILQIKGSYDSKETNTSEYENLGLARAQAVQEALNLSDDLVQLKSGITQESWSEQDSFEAVTFKNLIKTVEIDETIEDKIIIRFAYNSTKKLNSLDVENYLNKLAARVIKSKETIQITGHTDSAGPEYTNLTLGEERANLIGNYLIQKSVPKSQIIILSKGETVPIEPNSTREGRALNRRAELQIINQ